MSPKWLKMIVAAVFLALVTTAVYEAVTFEPVDNPDFHLNREQLQEFTRRAENGDGTACWCIAVHYLKNDEKYKYWKDKAAFYGHPEAQHIKGYWMVVGSEGNVNEGLRLLTKSAEQGNVSAQSTLGDIYFNFRGYEKKVPKDLKKAEYWYRAAAMNGDDHALERLAQVLMERPATVGRLKEAYKWLETVSIRLNSKNPSDISLKEIQENKRIAADKLSRFVPKTSSVWKDLDAQAAKDAARIPAWEHVPFSNECDKLLKQATKSSSE
jgi:TPR repeat protein